MSLARVVSSEAHNRCPFLLFFPGQFKFSGRFTLVPFVGAMVIIQSQKLVEVFFYNIQTKHGLKEIKVTLRKKNRLSVKL